MPPGSGLRVEWWLGLPRRDRNENEANTFNRVKVLTNEVEPPHWKSTTTSGGHAQSTVEWLKYSHILVPPAHPR